MHRQTYSRHELLSMAALSAGQSLVHQEGIHKGRPFGERRRAAIVSKFIRQQKQAGRLVEVRREVEATSFKRVRQFIFVPQTLELFPAESCDETYRFRDEIGIVVVPGLARMTSPA